jgi:hypothetical protein
MSLISKRVEESIKQAKLLAQMSEMSYRSLNGTRQTRSSFTNNDLKEQADTDKPAVGSLTSEKISQYKREEEENNKYVDPNTGDEFLYDPTGMTPTLNTSSLVSVPSLSVPATLTNVQTEQGNYAKILQDLKDKKQAIEDKIQDGKEKQVEMNSKEDAKKKTFDESTELTKEESDKTTKLTDDQKTLASLTGITKPTAKDKKKINHLNVTIPKLEARVKTLPALIAGVRRKFDQVTVFAKNLAKIQLLYL